MQAAARAAWRARRGLARGPLTQAAKRPTLAPNGGGRTHEGTGQRARGRPVIVAADTVLTGGRVWCGLGLPEAEAVATFAGRVLATGTSEEIAPLIGPRTRG